MEKDSYTNLILKKLSTPLAVVSWMLQPETDDYLRDGFAPRGVDLRDFCLIWKEDVCHFMYIDARLKQHSRTYGQGIQLGHATTGNFSDWDVFEPVLMIDPGHWDGRGIWAPNIIEYDGLYYMFYTGANYKISQAIGVAISKDLMKWERYYGNPVFSPGYFDWCYWSRETLSNCRDPHVYCENKRFYLYYTALCKTGEVCVAAAESSNLFDWKDMGPVIKMIPQNIDSVPLCLESACVHKYKNKYLLSYSHDSAIYVCFSDNHLSFIPENSIRVLDNHLALEKVMEINQNGNVWLVSFFSQVQKEKSAKLFFGILDLEDEKLQIKIIKSRSEMEMILSEINKTSKII